MSKRTQVGKNRQALPISIGPASSDRTLDCSGAKAGQGEEMAVEWSKHASSAEPDALRPEDGGCGFGSSSGSRVEALFREHNETLVRFLRGRLLSEADAREAAQEAYVRLLQLEEPAQPSFLRAYLFKVASNVATDLLRRKSTRLKHDDAEEDFSQAAQERGLIAREELAIVERALAELPPRCREAFRMSREEGLGSNEIALRLGVSDRMVRLYLVRCLEHLQERLGTGS